MDFSTQTGFVQATSDGVTVIPRLKIARSSWDRGIGLMGRVSVPASLGAGLFFPRCRALHTSFMRFALDVVFLDAEGQILEVRRNIPPWRMVRGPAGAVHCLEVAGGGVPDPCPGELEWTAVS